MDKWTGELIGKMHNHKVTLQELADHMGMTKGYVSMILNCQRKPPNAEERFNAALNELIAAKAVG